MTGQSMPGIKNIMSPASTNRTSIPFCWRPIIGERLPHLQPQKCQREKSDAALLFRKREVRFQRWLNSYIEGASKAARKWD